ncbi:Protein cereblon [Eumeta japonica]|uniref:Protein cereblon n=1 Tax=Eumeta variegata TaxID=151549 RepID=A0A4C2A033_EUMVA|nr:Protein cereblon [Eumeta japonica]
MEGEDSGRESEGAHESMDDEDVAIADAETESWSGAEEEDFDITLPPSHSYLSSTARLEPVAGRAVLEPGWLGKVPCLAHHSVVFPGETVPVLLLPAPHHPPEALATIRNARLFGLLCPCPDDSAAHVSDYGVVCEVLEVTPGTPLGFKARAHRRFRVREPSRPPPPLHHYETVQMLNVVILPDVLIVDPLRGVRLASMDARRPRAGPHVARQIDATLTPWPPFIYDMFDSDRLERVVRTHFEAAVGKRLPTDLVSLSFWAASNLVLGQRDRFALFVVDDVLQRLHMLVQHIGKQRRVVCCAACGTLVARLEHSFAMSSDGLHATFCNVGGHLHDVMTVSEATNLVLTGGRSEEFSWFPGYAWSIAVCAVCAAHIGWRFDACKRGLRPQRFWAICRNYVQPHDLVDSAE